MATLNICIDDDLKARSGAPPANDCSPQTNSLLSRAFSLEHVIRRYGQCQAFRSRKR